MHNLKEILSDHMAWLDGKDGGKRADLQGANLRGANLQGVNLRRANLHSANLEGANLRRANLLCANLYGANLRRADLQGANLQGANLKGADLRDTDLRGAILTGTGIVVYQTGRWIACITSDSIRIGYEFHSTEDWRTFDDGTIREMHPDVLDYWNENKDAILLIADKLKEKERG